MDRAELGWLLFEELDQETFEAWLDQQPDAAEIGQEIGGVYATKAKVAKPVKKQIVASMVGGRVTLQEQQGSSSEDADQRRTRGDKHGQ